MRRRVVSAWSSGKDSALALHAAAEQGYDVVGLMTTVTRDVERIAMHDVREALLDAQAASIGLPLRKVYLSPKAPNTEYEDAMRSTLADYVADDVKGVVFGDLFLPDIREWREEKMRGTGLDPVFPLWERPTDELARQFVADGFRAVVTCVDTEQFDASFCGREMDAAFFADLPEGVDPCGENGEFHSFCYDGPVFRQPVAWRRGEFSTRESRYRSCDLLPD